MAAHQENHDITHANQTLQPTTRPRSQHPQDLRHQGTSDFESGQGEPSTPPTHPPPTQQQQQQQYPHVCGVWRRGERTLDWSGGRKINNIEIWTVPTSQTTQNKEERNNAGRVVGVRVDGCECVGVGVRRARESRDLLSTAGQTHTPKGEPAQKRRPGTKGRTSDRYKHT